MIFLLQIAKHFWAEKIGPTASKICIRGSKKCPWRYKNFPSALSKVCTIIICRGLSWNCCLVYFFVVILIACVFVPMLSSSQTWARRNLHPPGWSWESPLIGTSGENKPALESNFTFKCKWIRYHFEVEFITEPSWGTASPISGLCGGGGWVWEGIW